MSVKALGIALKLTFSGMNQLIYPQTWAFTMVVVTCILTQMNYLNKVDCCLQSLLVLFFNEKVFNYPCYGLPVDTYLPVQTSDTIFDVY